jgi:hypothetical protein
MLPKQVWFCWGCQPMSYLRYMSLKSFRHHNPSWVMNLVVLADVGLQAWHTSEQTDEVDYKGPDYTDRIDGLDVKTYQFRSDIDAGIPKDASVVHTKDMLMWYLLATEGGIASDTDIIYTAPVEKLTGYMDPHVTWHTSEQTDEVDYKGHDESWTPPVRDGDIDVGLSCYDFYNNYIPVSFMAGSGNNPVYHKIYEESLIRYNPAVYESCGEKCIPFRNVEHIALEFPDLKVLQLPPQGVFPLLNGGRFNEYHDLAFRKDSRHLFRDFTIGVHWYAGSALAHQINYEVTADNVGQYDNTVCNIAHDIEIGA